MRRAWLVVVGALSLSACVQSRGDDCGPRTNDNNKPHDMTVPEAVDEAPIYVPDECTVPIDGTGGDDAQYCTESAPADSFEPVLKWFFTVPDNNGASIVMPLVGNFTDDNGDGKVDLCDVPDVLVTSGTGSVGAAGKIYMLAGDTGALEKTFDGDVDGSVTPAFGDLDGDGLPDVVTHDPAGHLVAYDHEGHVKWKNTIVSAYRSSTSSYCQAIAIYDLDGDGHPEIVSAFEVYDYQGNRLWGVDQTAYEGTYWCPANTAADLDGDGLLEVVYGNGAYHHDGTRYWAISGSPGQPQVANLDDDPEPEIFVARQDGILILEHDGTVKLGPVRPINEPASSNCWSKPGAIHDFDGDGIADVSASTCYTYGVYHLTDTTLSLSWSATVDDTSGLASTTAFDFLGRGVAQAVYGDQTKLFVFDGKTGMVNLERPRSSGTLIEYPVIADIDNDHSADIVVVSNPSVGTFLHTVDVYQDGQHRWIPTRRIWNQHAYHIDNIREDGTVPKKMKKSWEHLNTFRTNAQINGNITCLPPLP